MWNRWDANEALGMIAKRNAVVGARGEMGLCVFRV